MNKLTTILASTLLATSFGVSQAKIVDPVDLKIYKEMKEAVELSKDIYKTHCHHNFSQNGFNDTFVHTTASLDNVTSITCDLSAADEVDLLTGVVGAGAADLCPSDNCPIVEVLMATVNGSKYSALTFVVVPLFGSDDMEMIGTAGAGTGGEQLIINGFCLAGMADNDDLYVPINGDATSASNPLLGDVLGIQHCDAANDPA